MNTLIKYAIVGSFVLIINFSFAEKVFKDNPYAMFSADQNESMFSNNFDEFKYAHPGS